MRVILFGKGRMGREILEVASQQQDIEIVSVYDSKNIEEAKQNGLPPADVCIDFTTPKAVIENINIAWKHRLPIVVGTTGWYEHLPEIKQRSNSGEGTILVGSNFAPGVNLFFKIASLIGKFINHFDFEVSITEKHHIHKKDAPSGTAITLTEKIISNANKYTGWTLNQHEQGKLPIKAIREGDEKGTHIVNIYNELEEMKIRHSAKDRKVFAIGALHAARWIVNKSGFFTVEDFYNEILS